MRHPTSAETVMWGTATDHHIGYQEVSRCRTRGESQEMCELCASSKYK